MKTSQFWNFDLYSAGILVLVLSYLLVHCFCSSPFNVESLVQNWFKTIPPSLQYYVNIPSFLIRIFHRRYWIPEKKHKKNQENSRKWVEMNWWNFFSAHLLFFPVGGLVGFVAIWPASKYSNWKDKITFIIWLKIHFQNFKMKSIRICRKVVVQAMGKSFVTNCSLE